MQSDSAACESVAGRVSVITGASATQSINTLETNLSRGYRQSAFDESLSQGYWQSTFDESLSQGYWQSTFNESLSQGHWQGSPSLDILRNLAEQSGLMNRGLEVGRSDKAQEANELA